MNERTIYDLAWREGQAKPALEIRIDELPDEYQGRWHDPVFAFTKDWVAEKSFGKTATLWQWGGMSVNPIPGAEPGWSEFIIAFGVPQTYLHGLARHLVKKFGGKARITEHVTAQTNDGWAAFCHIEEGRVWREIGPHEWKTDGLS